MNATMQDTVNEYKEGAINRRAFIARLITLTGSMAATHLLLETSGLADTLVSEVESKQIKVSSETVKYTGVTDVGLSGYLSVPQGEGKFPAVLVIHENRGLNDHTRDVARRFAAEGFVALAPDILARKGGTGSMASPDAAREAIMALPPEQAIVDLKSALHYLNEHAKVNKGQLASVGFCWGGARSFTLAVESELLRTAVVFYGSAPEPDKLAQVKCPVLGLYGGTDERITSHVPEVAEAMKKANKPYDYKIYAGAGHAFFNDSGPNYNADAANDAWTRTLAFLRANLKA